jgi:glucan biosynthesis protein C
MVTELHTMTGKAPRLFFVDHLRVSLVILVVVHHVALVYGAAAPFYYVEPPFTDPRAFQALLVFVLVNQSFFMGALFLLAGYFTPESFDRKGPGVFLRDRLLRLGIPLVLFFFVLNPLSSIGAYQMPASLTGITTPLSWQAYPHLIGLGPLWFVAMLLLFGVGYAAWRSLTGKRTPHSECGSPGVSYLGAGLFVLALAVASYLVRMIIPLGKSVLGFPTLAYLPQYLGLFVLGIVAYRRDWFRTVPGSMGAVGLAAAVLGGVMLFPLAFSGRLFSLEITPSLRQAFGDGQWRSAVYALWDSLFAVGMCLALVTLFRRFFNGQGRLGRFLSRHSYAVYILHIPTVVFLAIALRGVGLPSLPKFALAAGIMAPACFAVAYLVRRIPGVSRIV